MKRFMTTLIASALVAGFALPASAADLPIPTLQKTGQFVLVKHPVRYHPTTMATVGWAGSACPRGCAFFPIVLGVTY